MKTQTIENIQAQIREVSAALAKFKPSDHAGNSYGSEGEYTPTGMKTELNALLGDIRDLVKAHSRFVKGSSFGERANIASNLENIKNFMANADYQSVVAHIDELKTIIRPHQTKGSSEAQKVLIERSDRLKTMISDSEDKLQQYTNAAKIGAAFTKRYDEERKRPWKNWGWLAAAFAFISIPIGWGLLFLASTDEISVSYSIARIAIMSVAFYGALFCSTRYVRYKNITEDYGYKSTLSNSMIAFLEQFQGAENKEERLLYLQTVLREIFQDPLRTRHDMKHPGRSLLERVTGDGKQEK